jgi:hypothetical protein
MHRFKKSTLSEKILRQQYLGLNVLRRLIRLNGRDRSNGSFKKCSFTSLQGRRARKMYAEE